MTPINRRQWLRTAGVTGALSMFGGLQGFASVSHEAYDKAVTANGLVRLHSNENPYGPSEYVRQAIVNSFDVAHQYLGDHIDRLCEKIAEREGVTRDHIVLTGGSREGLKLTGLEYTWQGGEIIAADPTYQALLRYAEGFNAHVHRVPLNDQLEHDLEEMEKRINSQTRLVFFCNPANPTGTIVPKDKVKDFCHAVSKRTMLFSDEAYYDYIEEDNYPSMVELVKENYNVIVSRTFSKVYGLAGVRIGYLVARPDIARRLRSARMANTNMLGIHAAEAALEDKAFYKESLQKNREAREVIYATCKELGLKYQPSHTNFVFFQSGMEIREMIGTFRDKGIAIGRPFPPMTDWCRISTGKMEDVQLFCNTLKDVMG